MQAIFHLYLLFVLWKLETLFIVLFQAPIVLCELLFDEKMIKVRKYMHLLSYIFSGSAVLNVSFEKY